MKKIINRYSLQLMRLAGAIGIICLFFTSCEDMMGSFLDKPPGVDVTEDTIFSTQINAERFLMGIYRYGMYFDHCIEKEIDGFKEAPWAAYCDEAESGGYWIVSNSYNSGNVTVNWNSDGGRTSGRYEYRWVAIRNINIFLDRLDDIPDNPDPAYKNMARGQALFIRGLCYFEMFKRYGGVPIVDFRFDLSNVENLKVPRATIADVVDFIVKDAEEAYALLPDSWPAQYVGKATRGSALMLKSRTLLYAASPLTNTATPPLSLPGEQNLLICYGDTDVERWKLAADAAKAVIDWAPGAGVHLLTGSERSYQDTWEVPDNEEVIMASKLAPLDFPGSTLWRCLNGFFSDGWGTQITQNFVEKYERKDGTPQVWSPTGGNNLNQMYAELDPRFGQSVAHNAAYWNQDIPEIKLWEDAPEPNQRNYLITGYWLKKWVPTAMTRTVFAIPVWNLYRLGEAYLNYAEALNEYYPTPPQEAYDAVKIIRDRVGMPPFPAGLSQAQFRERIRNERAIELAFEEHRLWDIIRWRIAEQEGVMQGQMWGIKIYKLPEPSTEFRWEPFVFEERYWKAGMYRLPFLQNEINKGYLVQNPGW